MPTVMAATPDPEPPTADLAALDVAALEALARHRLDPQAYDYIARGSGDGVTAAENVAAWRRVLLRPHVLSDVSSVDTRVSLLGTVISMPIIVAPTAMHRFACEEGEPATARAAATSETLMVVSMAATTSFEDVAAAAPTAPRWAQMYMLRDRGRTRALAERARDAGYQAIVASVDGASVPYGRAGAGSSLTPPPDFPFPNLVSPSDPDASARDLMSLVSDFDTSVVFEDLARFGEWSGLPVVVKGVLRADDATRCIEVGARGIIVSNHGGRIVDGTVSTAAVLPDVVDAVRGRGDVYVDGGIRTGADVVKAVALGARAVLVGRPVLWGLAVAGERGARSVLQTLGADLRRVMAFCGAARVADLSRDLVVPAGTPAGTTEG